MVALVYQHLGGLAMRVAFPAIASYDTEKGRRR